MEVPVGFLAKLWSFLSFLPFFFLLSILGFLKAAAIGPVVVCIIGVGNSAVVIGLWMAHAVWIYYCVARTNRLGLILKILVLLLLPGPLLVWPIAGIVCSFLGAIGYGVFAPLIAKFEAVGENVTDKFYHCFADGCWLTIEGSCAVVRDFTDFCFHSYFSYMDELRETVPSDVKPVDVKLSKLPSCLLVSFVGVLVDVIPITAIALWTSPYMLFRGWKRLLEDLIGREGPFLETVCVPFAGAVLASFFSSFFLGLYSGVIVHQENSFWMGLAYIVAVVSMFDEYVNDMLYLREGSCLLRFVTFALVTRVSHRPIMSEEPNCKPLYEGKITRNGSIDFQEEVQEPGENTFMYVEAVQAMAADSHCVESHKEAEQIGEWG